jgi:hypothetical protein
MHIVTLRQFEKLWWSGVWCGFQGFYWHSTINVQVGHEIKYFACCGWIDICESSLAHMVQFSTFRMLFICFRIFQIDRDYHGTKPL